MAFTVLDHRRKLLGIADHQQLDATERTIVHAVFPQGHVHSIQQVGAHHGYFIDNEQVERTDNLDSLLAKAPVSLRHLIFCDKFLYIRKIRTQRELKE